MDRRNNEQLTGSPVVGAVISAVLARIMHAHTRANTHLVRRPLKPWGQSGANRGLTPPSTTLKERERRNTGRTSDERRTPRKKSTASQQQKRRSREKLVVCTKRDKYQPVSADGVEKHQHN